MDFSKFDAQVDQNALKEQIKTAQEYSSDEDLPAGYYFGEFDKFELKPTKDGRPMFSCQFRIHGTYEDGESMGKSTKKYAKKCVFMNHVIYGTKNDPNMIASLLGWLKKLNCDFPIEFEGYSKFDELIKKIADDIKGIDFNIYYDASAFNSIGIEGERYTDFEEVPFE